MLHEPAELLERLKQSGLLTPSIAERRAELLKSSSAEQAASELVRLKLLTEYQACAAVRDDSIPLSIGDYIVEDMIGRGGMGFVLRARHRRMKRQVAIKFLHQSMTESPDLVARFEREVEAAAQLDHQNIVTAYDAGEHNGSHYLVMQYVDGEDLSHRVKRDGPLRLTEAISVIRQAAAGLGYAHEKGIVHRDIKPGNLLIDREGIVRILDMGLARMRPSPGDAIDGGVHADLTSTGSVMGTIDYMAPEQALDAKTADPRADIYALGCTLYFLLTGNPPYRSDTIMRRLLAHREQDIPLITHVRPEAPSELDQIFATMMAKDKEDRYPSMQHLIASLDSLELDDAEQLATIDASDRQDGGFVRLPEGQSASEPLSLGEMSATIPTGSAVAAPADQAVDATVIEPATDTSQTVINSETVVPNQTGGISAAGETSAAAAVRGTKQHNGRMLLRIIAVALVAVMAIAGIFAFSGNTEDPMGDAARTVALQSDTGESAGQAAPADTAAHIDSEHPKNATAKANAPAAASSGLSAEREIAEWIIQSGEPLTIYDGRQQRQITDISQLPQSDDWTVQNIATERVPPGHLLERFPKLRQLQVLKLTGPQITDSVAEVVGRCQRLDHLHLVSTAMTDDGIQAATGPLQLSMLQIAGHSQSNENTFRHLGRLESLRTLDLTATSLEPEWLKHLQGLDQLTSLTLNFTSVTSHGLARLHGLPIESLDLHRTPIHGSDWKVLLGFPELRKLSLGASEQKSHLDPPAVTALRDCRRLRHLALHQTPVSPASLEPLQQLHTLELIHAAFDPAELARLAELGSLHELKLSSTFLTDATLPPLQALKQIRQLQLDAPAVSMTAVEQLHAALPQCRIQSHHGTFEAAEKIMNADRRAAEWVLSVGGTLKVEAGNETITVNDPSALPAATFHVREIDLSRCPGVTDSSLVQLRGLAHLTSLALTSTDISDAGLADLTDSGQSPPPNLKALNLERTSVSQAGLRYFAACPLQELLAGWTATSDADVFADFPELHSLRIARSRIPADGLGALQSLASLRLLALDDRQLEEAGARKVAQINSLEELQVFGNQNQFDISILKQLPRLRRLILNGNNEQIFNDRFWSILSDISQLQFLSFGGGHVSPRLFNSMPPLQGIRGLLINGLTSIDSEFIAAVNRLPDLHRLTLTGNDLTDADIQSLTSVSRPSVLDVIGCGSLTRAGIRSLSEKMPSCKILSTHGTFGATANTANSQRAAAEWVVSAGGSVRVETAAGLSPAIVSSADLPDDEFTLYEADLQQTEMPTDDGLSRLSGLSTLQAVYLSGTSVTDAGLASLTDSGRRPLEGLKRLYLDRTSVTADGLRHLAGSTQLQTLLVSDTSIRDWSILQPFPQLTVLSTNWTPPDGAGTESIAALRHLEILKIDASVFSAIAATRASFNSMVDLTLYEPDADFESTVLKQLEEIRTIGLNGEIPARSMRRPGKRCPS